MIVHGVLEPSATGTPSGGLGFGMGPPGPASWVLAGPERYALWLQNELDPSAAGQSAEVEGELVEDAVGMAMQGLPVLRVKSLKIGT